MPITPSQNHTFPTLCLLPQPFAAAAVGPSALVGTVGSDIHEPGLLLLEGQLLLRTKWKKLKALKPIPVLKLKLMYKAIQGNHCKCVLCQIHLNPGCISLFVLISISPTQDSVNVKGYLQVDFQVRLKTGLVKLR